MSLAPSNNKIVLITGINGYIASVIGLDLLNKGYTVRGSTRSKHSADALVEGVYARFRNRVEFVEVRDITAEGAFDEAVRGVTAVLHTASPIDATLTGWNQFIPPAVDGTLGILNSAYSHAGPQLEAFVLTSSIAAVFDGSKTPHDFSEEDWNEWAEVKAKDEGDAAPATLLYPAAKTAAERALWKFQGEKNPPFSISAVNPGVVTGPPVNLPTDPSRLNMTLQPIWSIFSGAPGIPNTIGSGSFVDVRDVAALHIWCLEHPADSHGQRYILAQGHAPPQAAADLLRRKYPQRKDIPVGEPGAGYEPDYGWSKDKWSFQSAKAEKALGRKLIGYEHSILDTVKVFEQYYR